MVGLGPGRCNTSESRRYPLTNMPCTHVHTRTMHTCTYVTCTYYAHMYVLCTHVRTMHTCTYVPCTHVHTMHTCTYHAHMYIRTMHTCTYVPCTHYEGRNSYNPISIPLYKGQKDICPCREAPLEVIIVIRIHISLSI